ncbi:hypothetical protein GCM10020367_22820 [Streptomyces sannanensis]|uniref:Gas vesicle protein n=1 Tax=Streptomyces sannanensis TaxID=285536 RepID=A0ABP6SAR7_9ACTN
MGTVTPLRTLALTLALVGGTRWAVKRVAEIAEWEHYDARRVARRLAELEQKVSAGRIGQEEHKRREAELLGRLEEIRRFWGRP